MVPKIIHYVWLGDSEKSELIKNCMSTWKKYMPDYEIKCWDMNNSPDIPWVRECIKAKKWAFASDYIRLYALYTEGGIYLDTDILVKKSFDDFLDLPFFSAVEFNPKMLKESGSIKKINSDGVKLDSEANIVGMTVQTGIIGAEKGQKIVKEVMEFYHNNHFLKEDGTPDLTLTIPNIFSRILEKYGFRYCNKKQILDNGKIVLFDSSVFASGLQYTHPDNYAIHCYTTTWADLNPVQSFIKKMKLFVKGIMIKSNL